VQAKIGIFSQLSYRDNCAFDDCPNMKAFDAAAHAGEACANFVPFARLGPSPDEMPTIPVMRPMLPRVERIAPYIEAIDASRYYSNFGPLAQSFEDRLAARYGLPSGTVSTVANGTWGLALALAAQNAKPGTLCVMPAWTFVASAHAAVSAGLVPYFIDVDPETWALDPAAVLDAVSGAPAVVGAVMPVAPFGSPIPVAAWDAFRDETGLAVVVDAAAGFDALVPGATPAVVSLHATKVLGTGEGGFVVSTDRAIVRAMRARMNFGFDGTRQALFAATNAKFSEYHAAIGLAALDEWSDARADWMRVARQYRAAIEQSNRLHLQRGFGDEWIASTCLVRAESPAAARIETVLAAHGIETRRWWDMGAHAHPATAHFPRSALRVTETLARSTISLPLYRDIRADEIETVARLARSALEL
jgi:dTDP-4-amino-4,6-dideoxygalactose transaminase